MSYKKIAGVYMIRNLINGKIYIGASSDIRTRWKAHRHTARAPELSDKENRRIIVQALRKYGLENFEFTILDASPTMASKNTRLLTEAYYIAKYQADDPKFGYNLERGFQADRSQYDYQAKSDMSVPDKCRRSKPIIEYDIVTGSMQLYLNGARGWGKLNGYGKDVASHTVKRGSIIADRYYLIYADPEERHKQLEIIRANKVRDDNRPIRSKHLSEKNFKRYADAVKDVDENWG